MKTSDFDFVLPEELIASHPLRDRDASRMLVVNVPPFERGAGAQSATGGIILTPENRTVKARAFAKVLRKSMTMHECLLWKQLRKSPNGFSFRKQHPVGPYIADFVNLQHKLVIELDGGGQLENTQIAHDAERDKFLSDSGYRIIRFWNVQVYKNMQMVLDTIHYYLINNSIPKLQDFYPREVIDSSPSSAMPTLPLRKGETIQDQHVRDFLDYLRPGDVVVFNNSRVIPARFDATAQDGKVYEITLHTSESPDIWWGLAKKFNKLNVGDILTLDGGTKIEILDKNDDSGIKIRFHSNDVFGVLDAVGKMPLPPYMKRGEEATDRDRYQTIYADPIGSMAAPTAGLHFTDDMLCEIERRGATIVNVTLHVGAGTWMPVKTEDLSQHKMHAEWGCITPAQVDVINAAKRVIAVGTTSLRLLESAATGTGGCVKPFCASTNIFITPGYEFKAVDVLLTNFHLPKSTLFMLVSAFAGVDEMRAAYEHAIEQQYRFFSYGDCCLLFNKKG
ncbi:MAG: tRNA preQ1(34) S-adenosylmethionine ribosyltransferase-isomerase QueA [Rickettsiales bacterium]|jgi:S-adenosylmethionine:tRNA ribosyltransferase-isomerase|nr:tRNA preQ1(34) S-adenosylmethionine ribosyltransferase-isomerase QueA [Rickettsiales bacterium]